jgi:acyl carrier protein
MPETYVKSSRVEQSEIEAKVRQAVAKALDIAPDRVHLADSMQSDLGAESLDYLDIAFQLERDFNVQFPRADLLQRASEHFGEDALVKDGLVTDLGLKLLARGMPELSAEIVKPGLRAADVASALKVETFARILNRLLVAKEAMPKECPDCGGELAESATLPEVVCGRCGKTVPMPSGDTVLLGDLIEMSR